MPIYKRCARCGRRLPEGTTCSCYNAAAHRKWAKPEGIRTLYHTQRWKDTRAYVISQYDGADLYELYNSGRLVPADTVHHIEPTSERPDLFFDVGNMIPVSRRSHDSIHDLYKRPGPDAVKEQLRQALLRYKNGDIPAGGDAPGGGR